MELPKVKEVCSATALQCFLFVALRGDFDEKIGPLLKWWLSFLAGGPAAALTASPYPTE
jgi:hypothetical protein